MDNNKTNRNLLYAVLGILVLVVSVTGATFAYYTATNTFGDGDDEKTITGNMATITFGVSVTKKTNVDETNNRGLIPMSNAMVQKAVSDASGNGICLDDNSNAACQIYKIVVNNTGTAGMFLDGYVSLSGGSGKSTDLDEATTTTMRWAQVFCTETTAGVLGACTTDGTTTTRTTGANGQAGSVSGIDSKWAALGTGSGHDEANIKTAYADVVNTGYIAGNSYGIINRNYIRTSINADGKYTQAADIPSALVYNQYIAPNDGVNTNDSLNGLGGDSYDATVSTATPKDAYVDSQVYYIVVWLSETGHNQTANVPTGTNTTEGASTTLTNFFSGVVTFNSAQGSEVTGTFSGYLSVTPDTKTS